MQAEKAKRRTLATQGAEKAQRRKAARLEWTTAADEVGQARLASFRACEMMCSTCACGTDPSPWVGFSYILCSCGNMKKGVCKKRECVQRRRGAVSGLEGALVAQETAVSACPPALPPLMSGLVCEALVISRARLRRTSL
eukprot:scaffold26816_cov29-Tisochrysis_lutea.AAC.4